MQQERQLLDVTTGKRLYTNMVIRSLDVTTERTSENVLMATVTAQGNNHQSDADSQRGSEGKYERGVNTSSGAKLRSKDADSER